ncbi:hypothetical protein Ahy_A07g035629 [Arachis hypogaea]|uniref:Uncharacterized protein n=1 Tax=Arachis hypogaea TaxID=3818 RepID=A0A445CEC4_ARAHY|nr:hypothetical protein Ahy_A07g035629 [Arachis hypogaea]
MADELSNVNGGSSTNDSTPVIVPPSDVTSRSEGLVISEGVNGVNNAQNPQQQTEFSRDYNMDSTSNVPNSIAAFRQHVEESHHDLMTTILNPMMANHDSKFDRLTRQVKCIAQIVDYDEGERQNARGNNEGFENLFQNENDIFRNRENPQIIPRGQNADDVLARLRANQNARSRCYVSLPESEVAKIAVMSLEFYMRRKLLNVHIPDLAHLAERVCHVEILKKEMRSIKMKGG